MESIFDCVVVGAGVAGMTSAIYLKRSALNVLLLEKSAPGGQINQTSMIENYPGFQKIDGITLANKIFEQIKGLKIDYQYGNVEKIEKKEDHFVIKTDREEIFTKYVILATGRKPKKLDIPDEEKWMGKGISYCATCDGMFFKNKKVAVVGSGNSALEESLYLADICESVTILNRKDTVKADIYLQEKVKEKKNIVIKYNVSVTRFLEKDNHFNGVKLNNDEDLLVDGLFVFVGQIPDTPYLKELPIENEQGYIIVDTTMKTSMEGLYACGDCIKKEVYQIATAVGEGTTAAMMVKKDHFEKNNKKDN